MKYKPFEELNGHKIKPKEKDSRIIIRRKNQVNGTSQTLAHSVNSAGKSASNEDLTKILRTRPNEIEFLDFEENIFTLKLLKPRKAPSIPTGYYFKGGVARETLRQALHPHMREISFRDHDLVRFSELSDKEDHRLSLQFMHDDYCFGRGVEVIDNKREYFETRDMTMNEVLYRYPVIECTTHALRDLYEGVIAASEYRINIDGNVVPNTGIKMLRFKAEGLAHGIPMRIHKLQRPLRVNSFDIALNINRCLQVSDDVTREFLQLAWEYGVFPEVYRVPPSLESAIKLLAPDLKAGVSFFSNLPAGVIHSLTKSM